MEKAYEQMWQAHLAKSDSSSVNANQSVVSVPSTAQPAETTKPTIRLLHNMARSGGTVVSKCLATMNGALLLSELHPQGVSMFNPLKQAHSWFHLLSADELARFEESSPSFTEAIAFIQKRAEESNRNLIVRDWSHLDFIGVPFVSQLSYRFMSAEALKDQFRLVRAAIVRHPIDQWLSLRRLAIIQGKLSLDEFLRGYVEFARQCREVGFIRFEDFTREPDAQLQALCDKLELPFDSEYRHRWMNYDKITGDGSKMSAIQPRPHRAVEPGLVEYFERNESYQEAIYYLGYNHPE